MIQQGFDQHSLYNQWRRFAVSSQVALAVPVKQHVLVLTYLSGTISGRTIRTFLGRCWTPRYTVHRYGVDLLWRSKTPSVFWSHIQYKCGFCGLSSLKWDTTMPCRKYIIIVFVEPFKRGDTLRALWCNTLWALATVATIAAGSASVKPLDFPYVWSIQHSTQCWHGLILTAWSFLHWCTWAIWCLVNDCLLAGNIQIAVTQMTHFICRFFPPST